MKRFILYSIAVFTFFACKETCHDEHLVAEKLEVNAFRFDQEIRKAKSVDEVKKVFEQCPEFEHFFLQHHFPDKAILYSEMLKLGTSPEIGVLFDEVNKKYGDFKEVEEELSLLFRRVQYYYPDFEVPKVVTFVSGLGGYDLVVNEKLIIIGLDYFLGKEAKFRPNDFPEYILKHYEPQNIASKICYFIAQRYANENLEDFTMLAQMVFHGKVYAFTKTMMPCTADSIVLEYSETDLKMSSDLDGLTWAHFQQNQLFYSSDHTIITKYIDNRPHTLEIGDKCPGRIGRWLGYEIVKSYSAKNEVSIQELMDTQDAKLIFTKSKYKPKNQL